MNTLSEMTLATVRLKNPQEALALFGENDSTLRKIRELITARLSARGETVTVSGNPLEVSKAEAFLRDLLAIIRQGGRIEDVLEQSAALSSNGKSLSAETQQPAESWQLPNKLKPKTPGQRAYLEAIRQTDMVFGIGPAGTGKSYLAVAMAVAALKERRVKRIILARPAVEAGEHLGFLPGDLQAKIDPYLRPLYDALYDMLDVDRVESYIASKTIEIAPLAYMRGRTLSDAFIILDEAQNTTPEQMKMFLTRMGFASKVVVTGDVTQIDLPRHQKSGLAVARQILEGVEGIHFHHFTESDVVRHPLVGRIIRAYDLVEDQREAEKLEREKPRAPLSTPVTEIESVIEPQVVPNWTSDI